MTELAFSMKAEQLEKGSTLFNVDDISSVLIVVFTGLVEILSVMDNGTEFPIERLGRGSVINAHSFLIEDTIDSVARCGVTSSIYVLSSSKFSKIADKYPGFAEKLNEQLS